MPDFWYCRRQLHFSYRIALRRYLISAYIFDLLWSSFLRSFIACPSKRLFQTMLGLILFVNILFSYKYAYLGILSSNKVDLSQATSVLFQTKRSSWNWLFLILIDLITIHQSICSQLDAWFNVRNWCLYLHVTSRIVVVVVVVMVVVVVFYYQLIWLNLIDKFASNLNNAVYYLKTC